MLTLVKKSRTTTAAPSSGQLTAQRRPQSEALSSAKTATNDGTSPKWISGFWTSPKKENLGNEQLRKPIVSINSTASASEISAPGAMIEMSKTERKELLEQRWKFVIEDVLDIMPDLFMDLLMRVVEQDVEDELETANDLSGVDKEQIKKQAKKEALNLFKDMSSRDEFVNMVRERAIKDEILFGGLDNEIKLHILKQQINRFGTPLGFAHHHFLFEAIYGSVSYQLDLSQVGDAENLDKAEEVFNLSDLDKAIPEKCSRDAATLRISSTVSSSELDILKEFYSSHAWREELEECKRLNKIRKEKTERSLVTRFFHWPSLNKQ